ncbi:MAG TPA: putative peptidoglycan glycosyltransferase FtsW [Candidatus Paceibacterota bacterium]
MRRSRKIDYVILVVILLLVSYGLLILSSASSDIGQTRFDNPYHYLWRQIIYGLGLGLIGFLAGLYVPYAKYKKLAPLFLFLSLIVVILPFTPLGFSSGGASRWINLGPFSFQPAEILKIFFIIYIAAWLSSYHKNRQAGFMEGLIPFLAISGFVSLILLLQRSTSAMVLLMVGVLAVYFASGAKKLYILSIIVGGFVFVAATIYFTPYRLDRITSFLTPHADVEGSSYQINQARITIGSGGLWGVGYGNSLSKEYLPERIGDSIFAIVAEEFGFVGATALMLLFLILITRGFILSKKIRDPFGKLLLVGFSTIIGFQAFVHIGSISGLIPLTGVPLPYISYGGTALAVFMTIAGIMLNISKNA